MKKIVTEYPVENIISLEDIDFDSEKGRKQVIIYKRYAGTSYAMLARINSDRYGFVAIEDLFSKPNFEAGTLSECIKKVLKAPRDIRVFENMGDFYRARFAGIF